MADQALLFQKDQNGTSAYAPNPSNNKYSVQLTAGSNATLTLPNTQPNWIVFLGAPGSPELWVAYGATAVAPSSGSFATSNSELNPGARVLPGGSTINVLNNGASTVNLSVVLYAY